MQDTGREPAFVVHRRGSEDGRAARYVAGATEAAAAEMSRHRPDIAEAVPPGEEGRSALSEATVARLRTHAATVAKGRIAEQQTFKYRLPIGAHILAPPYDREWRADSAGSAEIPPYPGYTAHWTGALFTIAGGHGRVSHGVGLFVTAERDSLVALTPHGAYRHDWSLVDGYFPWLRSSGGFGVLAFDGDVAVASRIATLWDIFGVGARQAGSGRGRIAEAASPAGSFGPVPLAPLLVAMRAGRSYLFWVWMWQSSRFSPGTPFISTFSAAMPFVTADAGPLPVIR